MDQKPQRAAPSALLTSLFKNTDLLTSEEAASYIGVTPRTMGVWRCVNRHRIPYIKVGRLVKYRPAALDAWLASRTVNNNEE